MGCECQWINIFSIYEKVGQVKAKFIEVEQRCLGWCQYKKQELLRLLELYQANDSTPENAAMIENQHKNIENFGSKKVTEIQKIFIYSQLFKESPTTLIR